MSEQYFHFTLGPVQGFVSQARRTRDFWAGSFILSWLTANAMKSVREQGGKITLPDVTNDALLRWVENKQNQGEEPPSIGTIPNRFSSSVPAGFDGQKVAQAVQDAWKKLADAVWQRDLASITNENQKKIWDEQIGKFWEISWVLVPDSQKNMNLLDRRKNWRSHYPPEQNGDKCTIMGEWQELSGVTAPNRADQDKFWTEVRSNIEQKLDLREGERLCAISYVKRRFVYIWDKLYPKWELGANVPSVSYMAAVHWIEELIKADPDSKAVENMCNAAKRASAFGERLTRIECISNALNDTHNLSKEIDGIDGRLFFGNELRQLADATKDRGGEISGKEAQAIREARKKMLESIPKKEPDFPKEPTPFYSILLMDGDNLGAAIVAGKAGEVSKALESFTNQVLPLVTNKNGFLIYAGGDDVLALIPIEDALPCAVALREHYLEAFKQQGFDVTGNPKKASISAAVIYAHMKLPLTAVLKDSHRLLDDVAKEKTGRDAIAVRVWKPGGIQLTWAMKWDDADGAAQKLEELAQQFRQAEEGAPGHASKPLFRIRERLEMLNGGEGFTKEEIEKLLTAEYATSGVLSKEDAKNMIAGKRVELLLPLCKKPDNTYGAEAAMLLRFLAQKGVER